MASPLLPGGILPPGEPTIDIAKNLAANPPTFLFATPTTKPINPNAAAQVKARSAAQPEAGFEGLQEVTGAAGKAEAGFEGLQEVDPGFEHLKEADKLDYAKPEELKSDDSFHPGQYIAENPDVTKNPEKFQKLLDVYRAKREAGLSFGKVAEAAVKEAPGILGKTVKGAKQLTERVLDIGLQPGVNAVLNKFTGDTPEEQAAIQAEAGKAQLKGAAEITAGTEQAVTGLAQLAQQGGRKLFGKPVKELSDAELETQLREDAEFHKALTSSAAGKGEASQALGLDADFLQKNGVDLDPDAISNLSLVDPLTLVATAGVFKVVGVGGRILATAATRAGADAVIQGLKTVAGKSIQIAGRGVELAGQGVQKFPLRTAGAVSVGGQLAAGNIPGAAIAAVTPAIMKGGGKALETAGRVVGEAGQALQPGFTGPKSAGLIRLGQIAASPAGQIAGGAVKGAVVGGAVATPLALAAQENETAGALLGGGIALGAAAGAAHAAKGTVAEAVAKRYLDPHSIPFQPTESPGYGIDANLDATHDAAIKSLPPADQNAVNNFREAIRGQGGEIYVQDSASYKQRILDSMQAEKGGEALTPEEISKAETYANTHAFFDGFLTDANGQQRKAIFLNSSAKGLSHDAGHLFQSLLAPDRQAALRQSVLDSYTPEQLNDFADRYSKRLGDPEYFNKLGPEASKEKIADEIIAENFSQLFGNTPLSDLKAPKGFLSKLGQVAAEAAEALGIDLTAGRTTPDLQANPSYRLQNVLRNAAKDVLNLPEAAKPAPTLPKAEEIPAAEPAPAAPTAEEIAAPETPVLPPSEKPVSSEPDAAAKRAQETGVTEARALAADNPDALATVDKVAASMEAGNPALKIEHRGITTEAGAPRETGRSQRRSEQGRGYEELRRLQIENRKEAPESVVNTHEKTFVPVRFVEQGGKPTLIAMSLDKVIANIRRIVSDAAVNKATDLIPYETEGGKLTEAGWNQALADLTAYAENQSNGYRGDGGELTRPAGDEGALSIPAKNPSYTPKPLDAPIADFQNLIQGLAPPKTARQITGKTPGNVKGQLLAEINKRPMEAPAKVSAGDIGKQAFGKPFEGRTVQEMNPLRNQLAERGVNIRELTEVTERLAAEDIDVGGAAENQIKATVTDAIRAGFLPGPGEMERLFRPADSVEEKSDPIVQAAIRTRGGNVFTGAFHGEAYLNLADAVGRGEFNEQLPKGFTSLTDLLDKVMSGEKAPEDFIEDGFVTKSGKFLNRAEAAQHAEQIGQLRKGAGELQRQGVLESDEFNQNRSFLPEETERKFDVVWKPRAEGKTTFRTTVSAKNEAEARSAAERDGARNITNVVDREQVSRDARAISGALAENLATESEKTKGPLFLPEAGTPEFNAYTEQRIEDSKQFPEAIPLQANKDANGNYKSEYGGVPNWVREPWALNDTPLAKETRGATAKESEEKFTDALAKKLESDYHEAKKNPEVEAGETWYSVAREKIKTLMGDDAQFFAELLGATSPNTAVDVNFKYALEAYNLFKAGHYDKMIEKYREGRAAYQNGELEEFTKETGKKGAKATEKAFLSWWSDKHGIEPTSNRLKPTGEPIKFGMHTDAVMRVLDRSWLQQVEGPKTPNFTGNLSGATFEATIDKWAARALHRLSSEGLTDQPWRIQPPAETGVTDRDFFTGQKAFRKAADALGIDPDALQAILWFAEKERWEKNGWTPAVGAKKADYNVLIQRTKRNPAGNLEVEPLPKPPKEAKPKKVKPEEIEPDTGT